MIGIFQEGFLFFGQLFFDFLQILPYFMLLFGLVYLFRLLFKMSK